MYIFRSINFFILYECCPKFVFFFSVELALQNVSDFCNEGIECDHSIYWVAAGAAARIIGNTNSHGDINVYFACSRGSEKGEASALPFTCAHAFPMESIRRIDANRQ